MNQTTLAYDPQDVTIENVPAAQPRCRRRSPSPWPSHLVRRSARRPGQLQHCGHGLRRQRRLAGQQRADRAGRHQQLHHLTINTDPLRPNRVLVTLPGNLSAGSYDLKLNDQTTCSASLPSAIKVVATPTLTVNTPTPSFGALSANTAVSVTGTGFVSTPRAYVAVNGGASGVSASALRAVTFSSATALTAVVPSGLGRAPTT